MKNNTSSMENDIMPVRLRLELKEDYLSAYQKRMLKRYGESVSGDSIIRDILIPSDMQLHNLHYAIQKLFGWQNSHLRRFYLPDDIYDKLTGGTVKGWSDLVGILFQPPSEAEDGVFWDDDYERGSFKAWLKTKYTGPYLYEGIMEVPLVAKNDVQKLLEYYGMMEVRESFSDYYKRREKDEDTHAKVIRIAPLIELTLEEMNSSIMLTGDTVSLLERLEVDELLAAHDEDIVSDDIFPVAKELTYNYDFGDNWKIKITKYKDCKDLLRKNMIDKQELETAEDTVINKYMPVCIYKEGLSVLDDVGGLSGFADLLSTIYEEDDKEEASHSRAWAKSLGWSDKKISNKKML